MSQRPGGAAGSSAPLAVVIGAGAMGMAAARRLALHHRILLADISEEKATQFSGLLNEEGARAVGIRCDVTSRESVGELASTVAEMGGLGVLAHIAGLSPSAGSFRDIVEVNLKGPAYVTQAMLPLCRRGSAAVLVSSMAGHTYDCEPGLIGLTDDPTSPELVDRLMKHLGSDRSTPATAYALSKRALLSLVRREAGAWGKRGARIVSLSPGMIATPMGAAEFARNEGKRLLFERTPLAREGTLHEIANAIEFLLSDRASFVTGTDLLVDGGLSAAVRCSQQG